MRLEIPTFLLFLCFSCWFRPPFLILLVPVIPADSSEARPKVCYYARNDWIGLKRSPGHWWLAIGNGYVGKAGKSELILLVTFESRSSAYRAQPSAQRHGCVWFVDDNAALFTCCKSTTWFSMPVPVKNYCQRNEVCFEKVVQDSECNTYLMRWLSSYNCMRNYGSLYIWDIKWLARASVLRGNALWLQYWIPDAR